MNALALIAASVSLTPQARQDNVVLVLLDGIRWQEVFRGADPELMNKEAGGVTDVDGLKARFWREDKEERREALMPFLWGTVAKQGQVIGNRDKGSRMRVTNKFHFSYPGYSEMIVGFADDRINTNDPILNPNPSVFEFLNNRPSFRGRVAVFSVWSVVRAMMNPGRSGIPVNAAMEPMDFGTITPAIEAINGLKRNLHHPWPKDPYDALCFYTAMEYIRNDKPRALWITFGETDTFAHEGLYHNYLDAIHRTDRMLSELWARLQSMPQYKGKTTLIISVDHGRGLAPSGWKSHGVSIPGADETWLAVIGPHTSALGEREGDFTTSQIAATVAASVGQDYTRNRPQVAVPLGVVSPKGQERAGG